MLVDNCLRFKNERILLALVVAARNFWQREPRARRFDQNPAATALRQNFELVSFVGGHIRDPK